MATVTAVTVKKGNAVAVFWSYTKPTPTSAKDGLQGIATVPADPTTVQLVWSWAGKPSTTWTYGTGSYITKIETGLYMASISTSTPPAGSITGTVIGAGAVTARGEFTITVES